MNNYMVVIPAYNEADTIRDLVQRVLVQVGRVVVVDDGSTDDTLNELQGLPVELLCHSSNQGKAASLRDGMRHARALGASAVVTLDGDGQHAPEDLPRLIECAARHPGELVIAARRSNLEAAPPARLFANRFADFWVSWAAGQRIVDSQSGYRLYPEEVIDRLDIPCDRARGFVFESEVLIEAARKGISVVSMGIAAHYPENRRASHFRPVTDITRIVLMVAWKLIKWGLYPHGLVRSLRSRPGCL